MPMSYNRSSKFQINNDWRRPSAIVHWDVYEGICRSRTGVRPLHLGCTHTIMKAGQGYGRFAIIRLTVNSTWRLAIDIIHHPPPVASYLETKWALRTRLMFWSHLLTCRLAFPDLRALAARCCPHAGQTTRREGQSVTADDGSLLMHPLLADWTERWLQDVD
jgi:hypothetical protein